MSAIKIAEAVVDILGDSSGLDQTLETAARKMETVGARLTEIGRSLTLKVSAPLAIFGGLAVKAAVDMEALTRALAVSAGSADAAAEQLKELEEVAKLPGLGFKEAIQGAVQLNTAFAEMPDRLNLTNQMLREFGNAIALTGGGKTELDRVIFQLGQIAASGKLLTQDLRPIIQTAPAVANALRAAFGTINAEAINELGLSSEQFFNRLLDGLRTLPTAAGGAKNSFENLSDSIFRARVAIGEAMLPSVMKLLDAVSNAAVGIRNLDQDTIAWGVGIGIVAAAIGPLLIGMGAIVASIAAINAALAAGAIGAIIAGGGLIVALGLLAAAAGFTVAKLKEMNAEFERMNSMPSTTALNVILLKEFNPEAYAELDARTQALASSTRDAGVAIGELGARSVEIQLSAFDPLAERITSIVGHTHDMSASFQQLTQDMEMGRIITEAMRTPLEALDDTLMELDRLLQLGAISWETYQRAVQAAREEVDRMNQSSSALNKAGGLLGGLGALGSVLGIGIPGLGAATGLFGAFRSFSGLFAAGGTIPSGGWGIVGEAGPEIVSGPAEVRPMGESVVNLTFVTQSGEKAADSISFRQRIHDDMRRVERVPFTLVPTG